MNDYLLHISDFHLGKDLNDIGGKEHTPMRNALKQMKLIKIGEFDFQKHNILSLNSLIKSHRKLYQKNIINKDNVIGYAITGDITSELYEKKVLRNFHYKFLTDKIPFRTIKFGLEIPEKKMLSVIGNHDKLQQNNSESFRKSPFGNRNSNKNDSFTAKLDYIHTVESKSYNNRLYVFFVFDSNLYESGNISNGEISDSQIIWFENLDEKINENNNHLEYELVKIALLHHSPIYFGNKFFKIINPYWNRMKIAKGEENFQKRVMNKVDLVLCGHLHKCYFKEPNLYASGTVSEWNNKDEWSFNLISFRDNNIRIEPHFHRNGEFTPAEGKASIIEFRNSHK